MIITKTPFRISFFGGGTDFPKYYNKFGGCVIGSTINKYCYISTRLLPKNFLHRHRITWSINEDVFENKDIKHPIVKAAFKFFKIEKGLEIHHFADLPGQTGIGSSSSFSVGLINSLNNLFKNKSIKPKELAALSNFLEQKVMKESGGSQDSIWAAHGGFKEIVFNKKLIQTKNIKISKQKIKKLEDNLILFNTFLSRHSSEIEKTKIKHLDNKVDLYNRLKPYVGECKKILASNGSLDDFGHLLDDYWKLKKNLSPNVVNSYLEEIYDVAVNSGALGGKLLGAGGGGFYMFYCPKNTQKKLIKTLSKLKPLKIKFSNEGSKVIFNNIKL
jgi:D-glycero-alpha-D-manno-heptose-7-phosphate kinase